MHTQIPVSLSVLSPSFNPTAPVKCGGGGRNEGCCRQRGKLAVKVYSEWEVGRIMEQERQNYKIDVADLSHCSMCYFYMYLLCVRQY